MSALNPPVEIRLQRDDALQLAGWIAAHRTAGEGWEPECVSRAITAINRATAPPGGDDDD